MIEFITTNGSTLLQILGGIYLVATLIATLTPSDKDNTVLEKIGNIADRIGIKLKGK